MAMQTEYAWAAGFFDGEGCVSLSREGKGNRYATLRIVLVQRELAVLEHFRTIMDSSDKISLVYRACHKRVYYRLVLSGPSAADALTKMLPYLVSKREVAQVGLDLQDLVGSAGGGRWSPIPEANLQARYALVEKARWLNSGRFAAATTKPSDPHEGCDSLNCTNDKGAEVAETTTRLN